MNEKTIKELAQECIDGKWGRGIGRKRKIEAAGYDYDAVKEEVARMRAEMKATGKKNPSYDEKTETNETTGVPSDEKDETPKSNTTGKSHFKEPEEKKEEEVTLTPSEYFETVKGKINEETAENVKRLFDVTMKQLKKFTITGQKSAAKELYVRCLYLEKELKLINLGITKYVKRTDIDDYIDNVADDCVCVIEMKNFDRTIPDEIIDTVSKSMDIFDEFYVVFTDYTGETRSKVAKEKRDKDPILFGNIFIDGKVSPKMYFIGDWVDDYCDLTLDKMVSEIAKKESKEESDIVYDISDETNLDSIEELLFGTTKRVEARTVAGK